MYHIHIHITTYIYMYMYMYMYMYTYDGMKANTNLTKDRLPTYIRLGIIYDHA